MAYKIPCFSWMQTYVCNNTEGDKWVCKKHPELPVDGHITIDHAVDQDKIIAACIYERVPRRIKARQMKRIIDNAKDTESVVIIRG